MREGSNSLELPGVDFRDLRGKLILLLIGELADVADVVGWHGG